MSIIVLRKPEMILTGTTEQVVIGDSARVIDSLMRDSDGVVEDVTGWTASIIGHSPDLPGVYFDVPGEIVAPASAGVFRWTHVGDFLTQIGEKSRARFTCQVRSVNADGLVGYGAEFGLDFVVPDTGEDTNMNAAAVQALIDAAVHKKLMTNKWQTLVHVADTDASVPGFRSAGFNEKQWGGSREVQTPAGSNKGFVSGFYNSVDVGVTPRPTLAEQPLWGLPFEYRMVMNAMTTSNPTGECFQGIMVGGPLTVATPWQGNETTMFNNGNGAFVQLRFNFTRVKWEVAIWRVSDDTGENVAPIEVTDCITPDPFYPDTNITEACLRYDPAPNGGSVLRAYLNGQLVATVTSTALQSFHGQGATSGPGFFCTNGTNAPTGIGDAIFYTGHWWSPSQTEWAPA